MSNLLGNLCDNLKKNSVPPWSMQLNFERTRSRKAYSSIKQIHWKLLLTFAGKVRTCIAVQCHKIASHVLTAHMHQGNGPFPITLLGIWSRLHNKSTLNTDTYIMRIVLETTSKLQSSTQLKGNSKCLLKALQF